MARADPVRARRSQGARPIDGHSTRAGARGGQHNHEARARRYALRSVRPSPARRDAPEPAVWLPIRDASAALAGSPEAPTPTIDRDDRGFAPADHEAREARAALDAELLTIEAAFWSTSGRAFDAAVADPAPTRVVRAPAPAPEERPAPAAHPAPAVDHSVRNRHRLEWFGAVLLILAVALGVSHLLGPSNPIRYVALSVDGIATTVQTRGTRVADVLREADVTLAPADRVVPAAEARLDGDTSVRVLRAFPVVVDLDGERRTVRTTRRTAARLLPELAAAPNALVTEAPDRLAAGSTVVVRTPRPVTLQVDGAARSLSATALTVRELLAAEAVALGPNDEVSPTLDARLTDGLRVRVTRLAAGQRTALVSVPFRDERRSDPNLDVGQTRVVRAGVAGQNRVVYAVTLRDGVEAGRSVVRTEVVRAPVDRILAVGTRPVRRATAPRAEAGAPVPSSTGRSETGQGSHYAFTMASCAHKTLPFGTVVRITNLTTGAVASCTIRDRGPFGAGRILDMSKDTFSRLAPLGQGVIPVRIDW